MDKKFNVIMSYDIVVEAKNETDAQEQALDCFDFGSVTYDVQEVEEAENGTSN